MKNFATVFSLGLYFITSSVLSTGEIFAQQTTQIEHQETGAAASSPLEIVRLTVNQVIQANVKFSGQGDASEHRARLRHIINPHFNFDEMAKRSLGANWLKCTPEEQIEFVSVFSDLLAKTYLGRIDTITENIVSFDSEKVELPKALVKTTVTHKGEKFPIDYKLLKDSSHWRVYDVIIENIGLVANYRNEFAGIVRKDKISGLIDKLRKKNDKLES